MRRTRTLAVLASIALAIGGAGLAKASTNPLATTHLAKAAATSHPAVATSTPACTEPDGDPADSDTACPGTSSSTSKVSECENGEPGGDAANPDADDDCPTSTTKPKVTTTTTKPCPGNEPRVKGKCEFEGAKFYAAEDPKNQMNVLVDASAINDTPNSASGNIALPGPKVTDKTCTDPTNACDSVALRDADKDITNYHWEMIAWRQTSATDFSPLKVEEHHFDVSGTPPNPEAAQQFTKTQGHDVVQIILTVTEGTEGSETIAGPMPVFPINHAGDPPSATNPADLSPNVILEPCDNGGLITAPSTLADTLVDGGLGAILNEPEVNGALSAPIEQNTVGTPLGGLGNEVACVINALPGGAL